MKTKETVSTRKTPKQSLDEIYRNAGDVVEARGAAALPRGPRDLYNARHSAKKADLSPRFATEDRSLWVLLEQAKRQEERGGDSRFIRTVQVHPECACVLAHQRQLEEVEMFCTNQREFTIFGADPTFNVFTSNISLTTTTYRNLKLVHSETGESPVFIGPLLMHQRKEVRTYATFAHTLVSENPNLECILACGTDGEKPLQDGFRRVLKYSVFLLCSLHFRQNIEGQLKARSLPTSVQKEFLREIFGTQVGEVQYLGVIDRDSEKEFDDAMQNLEETWTLREAPFKTSATRETFYEWFMKYKAEDMKSGLIRSIRTEAGLGNPPKHYTSNDTEAGHFMIKHRLQFDAQEPHQFIEAVKEVIDEQFRNEDRAVFGKGPYRLRDDFAKNYEINYARREQMTAAQRTKQLEKFRKATMENVYREQSSAQDSMILTRHKSPDETPSGLSVSPETSGITTVPMTVLKRLFHQAHMLLSTEGLVVPKPGATDGSCIVAGVSNRIHVVAIGKGSAIHCDKACLNRSTRICEHVLAVAEKRGSLLPFLNWFRTSRQGTKFTSLALSGGPSSAGQKPGQAKRKRSNNKIDPATQTADILDGCLPAAPPGCSASASVGAWRYPSESVVSQEQSTPTASNLVNFQQLQTPTALAQPFRPPGGFTLKWLLGTTVRVCYGCGKAIVNPPEGLPDDIVIVCRDIRQFRDKETGTVRHTQNPENIHFHLRFFCVATKYANFMPDMLIIAEEHKRFLLQEHKQRIMLEFGIIL